MNVIWRIKDFRSILEDQSNESKLFEKCLAYLDSGILNELKHALNCPTTTPEKNNNSTPYNSNIKNTHHDYSTQPYNYLKNNNMINEDISDWKSSFYNNYEDDINFQKKKVNGKLITLLEKIAKLTLDQKANILKLFPFTLNSKEKQRYS